MKEKIMRIIHVTSMHDHPDPRIFKKYCLSLSRKGYEVSLVTTTQIVNGKKDFIDQGVSVISLKNRTGINRRIFSSYECYKICKKDNADIFHFHDPDLLPWMYLLSFSGKKVVYDIHENFEKFFVNIPWGFAQIGRKIFKSMESVFIQKFEAIVTISESLRSLYDSISKKAIVARNVMPLNGISLIEKQQHLTELKILVVSGNQTRNRMCHQIIKSLPAIIESNIKFELHFNGDFEKGYRQEIVDLAKDLNVLKYVIFSDNISWEENLKRISNATLGFVLYEDTVNNRVGIPNRIFDYMACGLPVIAENFTELRNIVNDTQCGLLVDSTKPEEIAQAVITLLSDDDKANEMGRNGISAIKRKYNFEAEIVGVEQLYKEILS